jgi:CRP-like cAMP-binding protein
MPRASQDKLPGTQNRLLAALPRAEYASLAPHLEDVELAFKQTLYDPGDTVDTLYFVERGVVSIVVVLDDGDVIEAGTIGNEGVVGIRGLLGADNAFNRAICQVTGAAKRIELGVIRRSAPGSALTRLLHRYAGATISMMSMTAACNRAHSLDQRMCRWLLMTLERVGRNEFPLTQEFMAQMLGVRRPSVSVAGRDLQRAGLIQYSRGRITVLDHRGLEAASCECYARIRDEFEQALELSPARTSRLRRARAR